MANRTDEPKAGILRRLRIPRTRYQKGRFWGSVLVGLTLLMSLFSNVRSTQFGAEPVAYAVFPVIVLFATVHTISYLNLKRKVSKAFVWIGLGLVALIAFGMSGYHIYEQALRNGQPWYIAIPYPFVVDFPSVVGMAILAVKDTAVKTVQAIVKPATPATPAKAATPTKSTSAAKTTKPAVPKKTAPVRTNATKTVPAFKQAIVDESAEMDIPVGIA